MSKLEIVKYFIQEIEEEQKLFETVGLDDRQAKAQAKKNNNDWYWSYKKYKGRKPNKTRIKDNCKKIRQLMLEISREDI